MGVSRQTVFRWKEGHVASPRQREHVTHLADKLRLTPAERNALLLSAGFAPDGVAAPASESVGNQNSERRSDRAPGAGGGSARVIADRHTAFIVAGLVLFGLLVAVAYSLVREDSLLGGPTLQAASGEALVGVASASTDEASAARRAARRLRDATQRELEALRIPDARAELVLEAVPSLGAAGELLNGSGAELLIWIHAEDGQLMAGLLGGEGDSSAARESSVAEPPIATDASSAGGDSSATESKSYSAIPLDSPDRETMAVAKWSAAMVAARRGDRGTARALLAQASSLTESSAMTDVVEATLARMAGEE